MARRFQSRGRVPRSQRRKFNWIGGVSTLSFGADTVAASGTLLSNSFDTRIASNATLGSDFTIVRVRGLLHVELLAVTTLGRVMGAYGICVIDGEAFDAGAASIRSPWQESSDDNWLYHTYWSVSSPGNTSPPNVINSVTVIDGKAMRKVNFGEVIVAVFQNAGDVSVLQFNNFRMGVLLA